MQADGSGQTRCWASRAPSSTASFPGCFISFGTGIQLCFETVFQMHLCSKTGLKILYVFTHLPRNVGYFSAGGNIMQTVLQFEQFFLHAWLETNEEKE